jgi:ACS family tartrate transporter-like MFS transporter
MEHQPAARSAIAKATRRLLPFLCLCYVVCFFDRVNVGFAALTMNQDLGFSPSVFGVGVSIFFVGYLLCEVPSNLALLHFGARVWIARIMVTWGLVAAAMSFVSGTASFYFVRFLLGMAEAGFVPGIILYLTHCFPAQEHARIISVFMAPIPIASVIGGPLSGLLLQLRGFGGLMGWQWLFILQGLPAALLGLIALLFLDDHPEQAKWLSKDERHALAATLAAEAKATRKTGFDDIKHALTEPRVLVLGLICFCGAVGLYGLGFLAAAGAQDLRTEFACHRLPDRDSLSRCQHRHGAMELAFRRDQRARMAHSLAASACRGRFRWAAAGGGLIVTMIALTLAALGVSSPRTVRSGPSPPTILTGTGAAAGFALINSIGNFGGLVSPAVIGFLKEANGDFVYGLLFLAATLVLGAAIAFVLGHLAWVVHKSPKQRLL